MRSSSRTGRGPRHSRLHIALLAAGMATLAPVMPVLAQATAEAAAASAQHRFDIPAQPLADALRQYMRQSGVQVVYPASLAQGVNSSRVVGELGTQAALERLLIGTGLVARASAGGSVTLERAPEAGDDVIVTGALSVAGDLAPRDPGEEVYSTPGSVHHVSRGQLDRVPYSRPGDIFHSVPGVAASGSNAGSGLEINIRGLQGMGRVKTLVDGNHQSFSSYRGYAGNREDTYIDPDLIAGIDIKKGPDAGPQGAGVVGGIVSMRTISARDIITDPDKNWGLRLTGMYGNNVADSRTLERHDVSYTSSYKYETIYNMDRRTGVESPIRRIRTRLSTGVVTETLYGPTYTMNHGLPDNNYSGSIAAAWRPVEGLEFTLAHAMRESGNYYAGSRGGDSWEGLGSGYVDSEVYNTSLESETWLFKARTRFLEDHSLELIYLDYHSLIGDLRPAIGLGTTWQLPLSETTVQTYALDYAWTPDNPWIDLRAGFRKGTLNDDTGGSFPALETETLGAEVYNSSVLALPLGELALKYGLSFAEEDAKSGQDLAIVGGVIALGKRTTAGSFIQGDWQLAHWLNVNAGLRHDRTQLRDGKQEALPTRTFNETSPSYGIVLTPIEGLQLYAQWSRGARAPSLRESFIDAVNIVSANPDLDPEKARNSEYGLNLHLSGLLDPQDQFGLKISRFHNQYEDYIVRLDRRAMGEVPPIFQYYKFANIDRAEYEGYEISADYDTGWAFASVALTYFDKVEYCYPVSAGNGTVANPYRVIPSACYAQPNQNDWGGSYVPPRQEKSATLGVRLFDRKLTLGGRMKMSTASLYGGSFRGQYLGTTVWDNYEIYDLFGSFKATKNLEVGFSVENLTDRFYVPSYSNAVEAVPSPGRTARGTITLRF